MKKYELTDEHREQLKPWANKWIGHAMSTEPIDHDRTRKAVIGLYAAAGLPAPRVVIVPSPFVAAFAYGAASSILATTNATNATNVTNVTNVTNATRAATFAATAAATRTATKDSTRAATAAATQIAVDSTTRAATRTATEAATEAAIRAATRATAATTRAIIEAATLSATDATTRAAARPVSDATWYNAGGCADAAWGIAGAEGIQVAEGAWRCRNSGNKWAGYPAYISFFRHIAKLDIDYSKWHHYEELAMCSGPRYMHADFCVVSDKPEILLVDDDNEPHCENGPFCRWRDGTRMYAVHGHYVPEWIIEHPERITLDSIHSENNAETRRIMRERYGEGRYLTETGATVLAMDTVPTDALEPRGGQITRALMQDHEGDRYLVGSDGSTTRVYYMLVSRTCTTCEEAYRELSDGLDPADCLLQS